MKGEGLAILLASKKPKEKEEDEGDSEAYEAAKMDAASQVSDAIQTKDNGKLATALETFFECCMSKPAEPTEDEE